VTAAMREPGRSGIRSTWRSWRQGIQVVEVIRDLAGREVSYGLSAGEKRMLAKARLILLQEG
jgi:hypothetical protein